MSSPITTHVLDTSVGKPAVGIEVTLDQKVAEEWIEKKSETTDADGRIGNLIDSGTLELGHFRLTFHTAQYFSSRETESFYPQIQIEFEIRNTDQHYHVPLLLNPFGYSTYRGS